MIPAFIALIVIAVALGGVIAFVVLHKKKKAAADEKDKAADKTAENAVTDNSTETKEEAKKEAAPAIQPEAETVETDEESDDEITKTVSVTENGEIRYIIIKYSKSFLAKLIQSDGETKAYYSRVKNSLLSYDGVKSRVSWKWESFRVGRKTLAKLRFRGKTLSLCLALNPEIYADTKYKVESLGEIKAYEDTPCIYRIKNDRRLKYSEDLISTLMALNRLSEQPREETDYAKDYPYETTEALLERKLIKELTDEEAQSGTTFRRSVTAQEVDSLMRDEVAVTLIKKSDGQSDRTKTGIINIDTLSENFESGEVVTLDEIKKRVKGFNKKTTYIKVLARGTLDKPLTVEADSFSLQAVKMIVLTGGTAIKK